MTTAIDSKGQKPIEKAKPSDKKPPMKVDDALDKIIESISDNNAKLNDLVNSLRLRGKNPLSHKAKNPLSHKAIEKLAQDNKELQKCAEDIKALMEKSD